MLKIDLLQSGSHVLRNLNNINIIMGRNGAGKSRFLRVLEEDYAKRPEFHVRYVSPERAGTFRRDGNILTNMSNNPDWLRSMRSRNQASDFKAASATLLREIEVLYLRRLASTPEIRNDPSRDFITDRLSKINRLLTNIVLDVSVTDFEFKSLSSGDVIPPDQISSGESEAVSLATEILYFFDSIDPMKFNVLFLDEPDVHLHPDLQARLAALIVSLIEEYSALAESIAVCVSTHSAPFVCALAGSPKVSLGTKNFSVDAVELKPVTDQLRKIAPFFGHPLSLSLCDDAALILEGEDDERVWQQAARSSKGLLKVFPVLAGTVNQQSALESFCGGLLGALYDEPLAFSIRDGDGVQGQALPHTPPVRRFRLACYAIENALVTDECLAVLGKNWAEFVADAREWLEENAEHEYATSLRTLIGAEDRLRHDKIKDIRQLICAVTGSNKPWELVVGQAIGKIAVDGFSEGAMLVDYLGAELVKEVVFRQ